MKALNKRINRKKASKLTLKTHRKERSHAGRGVQAKEASDGVSSIRPEDIRFHQQY